MRPNKKQNSIAACRLRMAAIFRNLKNRRLTKIQLATTVIETRYGRFGQRRLATALGGVNRHTPSGKIPYYKGCVRIDTNPVIFGSLLLLMTIADKVSTYLFRQLRNIWIIVYNYEY